MRTNDDLVDDVAFRAVGYLGERSRSSAVLEAMRKVDRRLFLPAAPPIEAYEDRALPIGRGQTCSEPSMVALMMDLLEIESGHRILEVGAGSGYASAIAALLCAPNGIVFACELLKGLAATMTAKLERWRERLRERGEEARTGRIEIITADGSLGFPDLAPFDRILLSAGVLRHGVGSNRLGIGFSEAPLLAQLDDEGILLYPETYGALHRTKKSGSTLQRDEWAGVAFVPLKGRNA